MTDAVVVASLYLMVIILEKVLSSLLYRTIYRYIMIQKQQYTQIIYCYTSSNPFVY